MTKQARWRIAGKTIAVQLLSSTYNIPETWEREAARYATDLPCGKGDLDLCIEPRRKWQASDYAQTADAVSSADSPSLRIVENRIGLAGTIEKTGSGYFGSFAVDSRYEIPFTAIIRTCLSFLCEQQAQLMLHASGVRRNGKLWIFCGAPGTGKSTIATELNNGGELFSSDQVVLGLDDDSEVIAHPTPFSTEEPSAGNPDPGKVTGIAFIEQAREAALLPVDPKDASLELLRESRSLSRSASTWDRVMLLVERLAERNLCFRLRFARDTSFWPLLEDFSSVSRIPGPIEERIHGQ